MVDSTVLGSRIGNFNAGRNFGDEPFSRTCAYRVTDKPVPNSSGNIITFPNGSTYRKHTSHETSSAWYEDGSSLKASAICLEPIWFGNGAKYETGPGGAADHFLSFAKNECLLGLDVGNTRKPPQIPDGRRNEVVTNALNGLAHQNANLGEALATLHQTFRLLRDPLASLLKGIKQVADDGSFRPFLEKSLRDLTREGSLNVVSRRYLEYVYGWKPLMQDIHDIMQLGKEAAQSPLLLKSAFTSRRGGTGPLYSYEDYSTKEVSEFTSVNFEDRVSCCLVARVDPEYAGSRSLNQLGLLNPLSLAWELVPFSFVVDWVIPIGSMLESFTAPAGLQFVTGSVSRRLSASCAYRATTNIFNQNYPLYGGQSVSPGGGTFRYEGYKREQLSFWPSTGLWIDIDPLRKDRSLKASALAIQVLSRGRNLRSFH